ncbi:MAG: gamma-glutamylcyclotransferase [Bryobacteraceae bacterium]|nr:gamma-glutamylcyclotransferase [Bryobacteraceae bacterium]
MGEYFFVYGTLRSGASHPMARWLAARAKLIGPASAQGRLYSLGPYPGMALSNDPDDVVKGEVYQLQDEAGLWDVLDRYEGEGFERVRVEARLGAEKVIAWAYVCRGRPPKESRIASGEFPVG